MMGPIAQLGPDVAVASTRAFAAVERYLNNCALAVNTVKAYRRQCVAYVEWLVDHAEDHTDAFADTESAESAVAAWQRTLLPKASPATVNQALAAVTLLYEQGAEIHIQVPRVTVAHSGETVALTPEQQRAVQQAADRRGRRDAAIIAVLLYAGAGAEECARLNIRDVTVAARTGDVRDIRLRGKGGRVRHVPLPASARDRLREWLLERGSAPGPLWLGLRGELTASGITQVVLAVGVAAGIEGLRPRQLRRTYTSRLRRGGADPAVVELIFGGASLATPAWGVSV